jgi:hypothetical protein
MYQLNNIKDATPFKTHMVKLPIEDYLRLKAEIMRTCSWDRQKWYTRLHGKTQTTFAEKFIIVKILGADPWAAKTETI